MSAAPVVRGSSGGGVGCERLDASFGTNSAIGTIPGALSSIGVGPAGFGSGIDDVSSLLTIGSVVVSCELDATLSSLLSSCCMVSSTGTWLLN